jgi:hypothetical protein
MAAQATVLKRKKLSRSMTSVTLQERCVQDYSSMEGGIIYDRVFGTLLNGVEMLLNSLWEQLSRFISFCAGVAKTKAGSLKIEDSFLSPV